MSEFSVNLLHDLVGLLEVGGIGGIGTDLVSIGTYLCHGLFGSFVDNEVGDGNVCAFSGKLESDSLSDSPGSACHEGYLSV